MTIHPKALWRAASKRQKHVVITAILWSAIFDLYFMYGLYTVLTDAEHRSAGVVLLVASLVGASAVTIEAVGRLEVTQ